MNENCQVFLKSRPGVDGAPQASNFGYGPCAAPGDLGDGEVLVKNLYLSVDPAQRCQMNEVTGVHYLQPWKIGESISGFQGVGSVVESKHKDFAVGDLVVGKSFWPWRNYFVLPEQSLTKVDKTALGDKPYLVLSIFGLVGLTSLIGIREKGHIQRGAEQTCVVSGAAGACGSLAGQIAKLEGCTNVVGICGSQEKCDWITQELGFESAINYKSDSVEEKLKAACPKGIDVYFDNVGGDISECVLKQMNANSHVVMCGSISTYNKTTQYPPPISEELQAVIQKKNITRDRFLVLNYADQFEGGVAQLMEWYFQGKIKVRETIRHGLENAGAAFVSMMTGGNIGKQLVKVADP